MNSNIVQLHEKVKFWLDTTRSPRFTPAMIDSAINSAIIAIAQGRFVPNEDSGDKNHSGRKTGLQRNLMLRNELRPLVVESSEITVAGTLASGFSIDDSTLPVGMFLHVGFELRSYDASNNLIITSTPKPITFEELSMLQKDPFVRLDGHYPYNSYYMEQSGKFKFYAGFKPDKVVISYLLKPVSVFYGYETTIGVVPSGTSTIIAQESCTINNVNYKMGDVLSRPVVVDNTSALVVIGSVNSNLPESLFDEIARNAAAMLLLSVGKKDRMDENQ